MSAGLVSVRAKYDDLVGKHRAALEALEELHTAAVEEMLPAVLEEVGLEDDAQSKKRALAFIDDRATLFRFYRRSRYSVANALSLLTSTLTWRLRTDLDSLSLSSLHPLYVSPLSCPPLFWCNAKCKDRLGRPVGVISLQSLERSVKEDGKAELDECREYIVGCMESVRRYLSYLYAKVEAVEGDEDADAAEDEQGHRPLQMVIIFSLQSSGMANLEMELLPFLLDLLKNHFPGMVGIVYIVHYGWVHSGMWALAKRVMPKQALDRILFPNANQIKEHFDPASLPLSLGGEWDVDITETTNDVLKRFARPGLHGVLYSVRKDEDESEDDWERNSAPPSPRGISGASSPAMGRSSSRGISRSGSFDSLADHFYSSSNTPWHQTPRASQPVTPRSEVFSNASDYLQANGSTPGSSSGATGSILRMTPSAARKLQQLQMTRGISSQSEMERAGRWQAAVGQDDLSISPRYDRSPIISRGASPTRTRSRSGTMQGRNVHFGGRDLVHPVQPDDKAGSTTLSRRGSLRDFRLLQENHRTDLADAESPLSEGSDESGKVRGEDGDGRAPMRPNRGFFSRWRNDNQSMVASSDAAADEHPGTSNSLRKHKQRQRSASAETLMEMDPVSLASPQLQVPDIDEPPLSGFGSLSEANNVLSRRSRNFGSLPGHISPYNASNPYYGYPAYPVLTETSRKPGRDDAHRLHFRKRKRDLLRTLTYLFVLRLLSMHRDVRTRLLSAYKGLVRAIRAGGMAEDENKEEEWREANLRYNRLRSASSRASVDLQYNGKIHLTPPAPSPPPQGQPLVQLGFRKRYAFLMLFLFIVARKDWRDRLVSNCKGVFALTAFGTGSKIGTVGDSSHSQDISHANLLGLDREATESSITGLHLRRRFGWQ